MTVICEPAQRNQIRAFRAEQQVLIIAEGELPTPGFDVDVQESLLKIFPQQFNLVQCPKSGNFAQVITPYRYAELVTFPVDQETVTIHHAGGSDVVRIEECPVGSASDRATTGDQETELPAAS